MSECVPMLKGVIFVYSLLGEKEVQGVDTCALRGELDRNGLEVLRGDRWRGKGKGNHPRQDVAIGWSDGCESLPAGNLELGLLICLHRVGVGCRNESHCEVGEQIESNK